MLFTMSFCVFLRQHSQPPACAAVNNTVILLESNEDNATLCTSQDIAAECYEQGHKFHSA